VSVGMDEPRKARNQARHNYAGPAGTQTGRHKLLKPHEASSNFSRAVQRHCRHWTKVLPDRSGSCTRIGRVPLPTLEGWAGILVDRGCPLSPL